MIHGALPPAFFETLFALVVRSNETASVLGIRLDHSLMHRDESSSGRRGEAPLVVYGRVEINHLIGSVQQIPPTLEEVYSHGLLSRPNSLDVFM